MAIQKLRVVVPPTLAQLLDDPVYAAYARRNPRMPAGVRSDAPWQLIARRASGAQGRLWALRMMPTYADAYRRARSMIGDPAWEDVSICSRGVMFKPPLDFVWNLRFDWCARCRRPSLFRKLNLHPVISAQVSDSLRRAIIISEEMPRRCYYCGIRKEAMPRYVARIRRGER